MTEYDLNNNQSAQLDEVTTTSITPISPVQQPSSSASSPKSPGLRPRKSNLKSQTLPNVLPDGEETGWGSNFWVTLVDPQSQTAFFACPSTGEVSWEPPVGTFLLPPSEDGEWWELGDESRGGLPYYYQTKTGETVWERPSGFVIPLSILQSNSMDRRLSQSTFDHFAKMIPSKVQGRNFAAPSQLTNRVHNVNGIKTLSKKASGSEQHSTHPRYHSSSKRQTVISMQLEPIPGSPNATDTSNPPSIASKSSLIFDRDHTTSTGILKVPETPPKTSKNGPSYNSDSLPRTRTKSASNRSQPMSLHAVLAEMGGPRSENSIPSSKSSSNSHSSVLSIPVQATTPTRPPIPPPRNPPTVAGKGISAPIPNHVATLQMSPVKNRATGKPILVPASQPIQTSSVTTLPSGTYPILPQALAEDIQQFSESAFALQYFSTHRKGFIFRRKIPVAQLMLWQKTPLTEPLLNLKRPLHKNAVKLFKIIQHAMGDRERDKSLNVKFQPDTHISMVNSLNSSTTSLSGLSVGILEEQRWLLTEGLTHGELRDEIYCQIMKQLTGNPKKESKFKGWQLLCVLLITFPPSKDFETYLQAFIQTHTSHQEGRVDVMAKYCLRRLNSISKKGPRGKAPSAAEIETALDAAFNPSTFGESLDAIIRLQERNYPHQKIPIILPFLADGILALGGTRAEGIFRIPGDNDSVSALKLRIDKGYYKLDGIDDPHALASLMKLWLRELNDPLVPDELYNECVQYSKEPEACIQIVERLPTINRRVVLFVISFLQIFLEERTQSITKMTPANLALVMAPNLLRCNSDSISVVFTNAQYEQIFVYNLLLHLRCDEIDPHYKPVHGLGAANHAPTMKKNKNRTR